MQEEEAGARKVVRAYSRTNRHEFRHNDRKNDDSVVIFSIYISPTEIDGAALEGLVFQHLRAWNDYSGQHSTLYFWRTRAGLEVDFVVYGEKELVAIEVKNAAKVSSHDLQSLKAFIKDYPESRAVLLYRGQEQFLRDGVLCVPCERFLKALRPGHPLPDQTWR